MSVVLEKGDTIPMLKAAAEAIADKYGSVEEMLLDEDAPNYSRPSRRFFNLGLLAAFELGRRKRRNH
jgi:hypothetical protein